MSDELSDELYTKLLAYLSNEISSQELLGESSTDEEDCRVVSKLFRFDEAALAHALAGDSSRARSVIESLSQRDLIKSTPNSPGVYLVTERLRKQTRSSFVTDEESKRLHQRMADYFEVNPSRMEDQGQYVLLFHRLGSSPLLAAGELLDRWKKCIPAATPDGGARGAISPRAKDGLSLAEARELMEIHRIQRGYLPTVNERELDENFNWTNVWSEHCDAWFRSQRLLRRQRVEKPFIDLVSEANASKRILELHAPGGSGKTMALRWFVTHHCIPRRMPVAYIDFDHLVGKFQHPSNILSRCIQQLRTQLPGSSLYSIGIEGEDLDESSQRQSLESVGVRGNEQARRDYTETLCQILVEALNSQSSVATIVVDTFEEALLQGTTSVPEFLSTLWSLVAACPRLRLIVSGRFAKEGGHFGDSLKLLSDQQHARYLENASVFRIPQFNFQETLDYLKSRDWIVRPDQYKLIPGVDLARKAMQPEATVPPLPPVGQMPPSVKENSPFHLAMLADLRRSYVNADISQDELSQLEAELLANMREVKVIYLIERVISRILEIKLRWMVRYGVAPRVLTKDFFLEVIVPYLHKVHEGQSPLDKPSLDKLPPALREKSLYVGHSTMIDLDPEKAWSQLCAISETNEWLEAVDANTLVIHPCIKQPMRALLKSHPVLREIHRDALKYFRKLQEDSADTEIRFEQEAIYHELQFTEGSASEKICNRLEELYQQEQFERVVACAHVVIDVAASQDEDRVEIPAASLKLCYQLVTKCAISLFDIATELDSRIQWIRVASETWLRLKDLLTDYSEIASWEALFKLRQTSAEKKMESQLSEFRSSPNWQDELWKRSEALGYLRLDNPKCAECLEALLDSRIERNLPSAPMVTAWLIELLTEAYGNFGFSRSRLSKSKQYCTFTAGSAAAEARAYYAFAVLMQRCGRTTTSAQWLLHRFGVTVNKWPDLEMLVYCASTRSHPATELRHFRLVRSSLSSPALAKQASMATWLLACVYEVEQSRMAIQQTIERLRSLGVDRALDSQLMEAELSLHHFGHVNDCSSALDQHRRSIQSNSNIDDWRSLRFQLLDYEILKLSDDQASAASQESLLRLGQESLWPRAKLRCAVTLLAHSPPQSVIGSDLMELLINGMAAWPDWIARSSFPWLFRRQSHTLKVSAKQEERFLELVNVEANIEEAAEEDEAWSKLSLAYLLRFLGFPDKARACWRSARNFFKTSLTGKREVWNLEFLLNGSIPDASEMEIFIDEPIKLRAVVALEQAENAVCLGQTALSRQWLTKEYCDVLLELAGDFCARCRLVFAEWAESESAPEAPELRRRASYEFRRIGNRLMAKRSEDQSQTSDETVWKPSPSVSVAFNYSDRSNVHAAMYQLYDGLGKNDASLTKVVEEAWQNSGDVVPHDLVAKLAKDPIGTMESLFDKCFRSSPDERSDWTITGDNLGALSLPWELAHNQTNDRRFYRAVANSDYPVRWLQEMLAWYLYRKPTGERVEFLTQELQKDFAKALETSRLNVDLLRSRMMDFYLNARPESNQRRGIRAAVLIPDVSRSNEPVGGAARIGPRLASIYSAANVQCEVIPGIGIEQLLASNDLHFDLVHVYAPYVQRRSRGVIEPALNSSESNAANIIAKRGAVPLVILDGPGVETAHEHMRQVMLRNATGTLLSRQSGFPNILGLPLELEQNFSESAYSDLAKNLASGRTIFEVLSSFNRSQMPALWSADPDLTVLSVYP